MRRHKAHPVPALLVMLIVITLTLYGLWGVSMFVFALIL